MRLFIGIAPDAAAREALAETARRLYPLAPGRYTDPAGYHLTLAFLGQTPPEVVPQVLSAMDWAVSQAAPFPLRLSGLGTFGRILWRGLEDSPALTALSARLGDALDRAGLVRDPRPLRPHITLARGVRALPPDLPALPGAAFTVRGIILFESARVDGRLCYLPRREVPLP